MAENIQSLGTGGNRDQRGLVTINIIIAKVRLSNVLSVQPADSLGLAEIGRSFEQRQDGYFNVHISLQGASTSGNFPVGPDRATYEFIPAFEQKPIESHPYIQDLLKKYGGTWDPTQKPPRVSFDPYFKTGSSAGGALPGSQSSAAGQSGTASPTNPMSGVDTWEILGGIFRKRYCSYTLPPDLLSRIGKIVNSLPNGYPTPSGRNWLTMPVPWTFKGNVYDITEELKLSKPGGWDPATLALINPS